MSYLKSTVLCLVKIKSPQGDQVRLFEKSPFNIGRDQNSDLLIAHASISRKHLVVSFDDQKVKVQDTGTVNGTYHCGQKVRQSSEFTVHPSEHLRLGQCEQSLEFQIIPRPMEFDDLENQKLKLQNSLKEVIQSLKGHAKVEVQTELQRELQQEIQLKRELALKDIQLEKENLESQKKALISKLKEIESQSQNRLQEEEKVSFEKISSQQREAQEKIQNELRGIQNRADEIILEARKEAESIRDLAQADSQNIRKQALEQTDALRLQAKNDGEKLIQELQNDYQIRAEKEKSYLLEKTKSDCQKMIAETKEKLQDDEKKLSLTQSELTEKTNLLNKTTDLLHQTSNDLDSKKTEFANILQQVNDAENIIKKSKEEKKNLELYAEQRVGLEQEMKRKAETLTLEYDDKKRTLEKELSKLASNQQENLKKQILEEEKRIKEVRKAQASEIARMIEVQMADRAKAYIHNANTLSQFSQDLFATVRTVLSTDESSFKPLTLHLNDSLPTQLEKNKKYIKPAVISFATALTALLFFYRLDVYQHFKSQDSHSVAKQMIEQRKIQSLYNPEQNAQYRESYMDNVLYYKHYSALKMNSDFQQKWTLRLNDIALIRELKVTEDRMVQFQAIETNLVTKLTEMKASIDAVYLHEGLEAMKKFEAEETKRLLEIIKGQSNFEKIKQLEREFIQSYLQAHQAEFP